MSIKLNGKSIRVSCPKGHQNHIPCQDWEVDVSVEEKPDSCMGPERDYRFSIEGANCTHPGCNAEIDASFEVYEYPVGGIEDVDCTSNVMKSDVEAAVEVSLD